MAGRRTRAATAGSRRRAGLLRTRQVLEATGITHQILYRYVTMGLIEDLGGRPGGHRRFPPDTIAVVKLIQSLNQTGYTLRDIKDIFFREDRLRRARVARRQPSAAREKAPRRKTTTAARGAAGRSRAGKKPSS